MNTTWTEARVARLTELWLDGVSAGLIAKQLELSKNAVVGKAHRLELAGRPSPIRYGGPAPKRENLEAATKPAKAPVPVATPESEATVPLAAQKSGADVVRRRGACQWIEQIPTASDNCKCNKPTVNGVYCSAHETRAHAKRMIE